MVELFKINSFILRSFILSLELQWQYGQVIIFPRGCHFLFTVLPDRQDPYHFMRLCIVLCGV